MGRYRFELAGPKDDAELRAVLAETPMPGAISVAFRREPSYFAAAVVNGRFRQVIAARDEQTERIVGFGSRSVGMRYVNGRPTAVGYLSGLRILEEHRCAGVLARGYAFVRKLHEDGRTPLYVTTIATENRAALAVLTGGQRVCPHTTSPDVITRQPCGLPARCDRLTGASRFRSVQGVWTTSPRCSTFCDGWDRRVSSSLVTNCRISAALKAQFRDLRAEDLWLAYRDGCLVGTLGGWDQHAFRQMLIQGYAGLIRWSRPLYNMWASAGGLPRLPRPGEPVRCLTAAIPLVSDEAPLVFRGLLDAMLRSKRRGPWQYLLVGMYESDPLLATLRTYPAAWYTTNVYLACWQDGDELRRSLDERPLYLELGSL